MATFAQYELLASISTVSLLAIINTGRSYRRLSHIPGPPLAAISRLWIVKGHLGTRFHLNLYEVNKKYGPLARIGPNALVTSDPELVRRMHANRSPYRRSLWYEATRFKPGAENVLSERHEEKHSNLRKKMASGYAGKENPGLESEIDGRIRDLINLIDCKYICTDQEPGRQMDFARKANFFTTDVISGLAFGQTFEYLKFDEDRYEYIKAIEESVRTIILMTELVEFRSFLEKSSLIKLLAPSSTDKIGLGKINEIAKEKVAERFGDDKKVKQDMLGSFLNHGLSQEEAESETVLQL